MSPCFRIGYGDGRDRQRSQTTLHRPSPALFCEKTLQCIQGLSLGPAGSLPGLRVSHNSRPDCPLLIGPNIPLGYPLGCKHFLSDSDTAFFVVQGYHRPPSLGKFTWRSQSDADE